MVLSCKKDVDRCNNEESYDLEGMTLQEKDEALIKHGWNS